MLELLENIARVRVVDRRTGTVEVEVDLPPIGIGPHVREILRAYQRARHYAPDDRASLDGSVAV